MNQEWQAVIFFFPPKIIYQAEVGGQEIHQEAVKLSAECVEELAGNVAGHQLGSPELHWEDASRGEGAVKLSGQLPGLPTEGSEKVPVEALLHRKLLVTGAAPSRVYTPAPTTETKGSKASQNQKENLHLLQCSFKEKNNAYHIGQSRM